jgi:hypothetical protein
MKKCTRKLRFSCETLRILGDPALTIAVAAGGATGVPDLCAVTYSYCSFKCDKNPAG